MPSHANTKHLSLAGLIAIAATVWAFAAADDVIADIPPVVDAGGDVVPGSIVSLERITLGGVEQTVLIRGQSADNPVLLYLHGGPGGAIIPWVDLMHTPELEAEFTVVHWDQRGAGSSYNTDLTVADLHPDRFVDDALELTNLLRERFGQDRIFLTGQSWGSALGFMTIQRDSSPFLAFIPISERVAWVDSSIMGYEWALAEATRLGEADIVDALTDIAPFDPLDMEESGVQRKALEMLHGGDTATPGLFDEMVEYAFSGQSPYYTAEQIANYMPGMEISSLAIEIPEFTAEYDLRKTFLQTDIPIHFITGERDQNTPIGMVHEFAAILDAPEVTVTSIEGAAHMVMWDQPEAWANALIEIKGATLDQ